MRRANYDKYPSTKVDGNIWLGWKDIRSELSGRKLLAVDFYTGVMEEEVIEAFGPIGAELVINTRDLLKPEAEVLRMTERFMTDDVLFGYVTNLRLSDYFQPEKVKEARRQIAQASGEVLVIGTGAAWVMQEVEATVVYADMARWEIQQRFRAHKVKALGVDNRDEAVSLQYKRGYFNDWRVCDQYKDTLFKGGLLVGYPPKRYSEADNKGYFHGRHRAHGVHTVQSGSFLRPGSVGWSVDERGL